MDTMIIGIAGGTGSGKTTLTEKLKAEFGEDVSVLYHDNYYKSHSAMPYEERAKLNYDHPDAFETDLLIRDIQALRRGETVRCPAYDYTLHDRCRRPPPHPRPLRGDDGGPPHQGHPRGGHPHL